MDDSSQDGFGEIAKRSFELLSPLSPEAQQCILTEVLPPMLALHNSLPATTGTGRGAPAGETVSKSKSQTRVKAGEEPFDVAAFVADKGDLSRSELLAVLARASQLGSIPEARTKAAFKELAREGRVPFSQKSFVGEMRRATKKAFFAATDTPDEFVLTTYGQRIVDALPNRQLADTVPRPKGATRVLRGRPRKKGK